MQIQNFSKGRYAGANTKEMPLEGLLLSETVYAANTVSAWHFHEHPYFALILSGGSTEVRKQCSLECLPGQAYFYNWQDVHRNKDYQEGSRNFNVELDRSWLADSPIDLAKINGITLVSNPELSLLLVRLFKEYTLHGSELSIQSTALQLLDLMCTPAPARRQPGWLERVDELLHDRWTENVSLRELADTAGVHPVHISRYFPRHVGCSLGEYVRKIRIARALPLVRSSQIPLTDVAYECGFADQSHFNRTFKELTNFTPGMFRKR